MGRRPISALKDDNPPILIGEEGFIDPTDMYGMPLKKKDFIAWPVRRKSDLWCSTGFIEDIIMRRSYTGSPYYSINVWSAGMEESSQGIIYIPRRTVVNTLERIIRLDPVTVKHSNHPAIMCLRPLAE
uniref:Uncharacterized protein n=1 Tax=Cyanothece sp. (strain PCC 7425 / ATCC 29141) TaxID=395961 RepID=B8HJL1_CYAP4